MPAYATLDELLQLLPQTAGGTDDAALTLILDRMSALVDIELASKGIVFGTPTVGTQLIFGDGTAFLRLPPYVAGSVTAVTTIAGVTVPTYVEQDGFLVVTDGSGVLNRLVRPVGLIDTGWWSEGLSGWRLGVPYTVAATFGAAAMPATVATVLAEAVLELSVRTWRAKDAGFSDVVGVEGAGAVTIDRSYPLLVKKVLAALGSTYAAASGPGVR